MCHSYGCCALLVTTVTRTFRTDAFHRFLQHHYQIVSPFFLDYGLFLDLVVFTLVRNGSYLPLATPSQQTCLPGNSCTACGLSSSAALAHILAVHQATVLRLKCSHKQVNTHGFRKALVVSKYSVVLVFWYCRPLHDGAGARLWHLPCQCPPLGCNLVSSILVPVGVQD